MQTLEPHIRFLIRGSGLLIALLTLWWFVLLGPMLYLLKGAAGSFLPIDEQPSGVWTIRVPVEQNLAATREAPVARQLRSMDFDLARADAITFTFSLPVFWGIMLAASGAKRNLQPLLVG